MPAVDQRAVLGRRVLRRGGAGAGHSGERAGAAGDAGAVRCAPDEGVPKRGVSGRRYSGLSDADRKRLELDEDRLLSTLLHNMTAAMLLCGCPKQSIQQKIRRLLGKSHVGLIHSQHINNLLDCLPHLVRRLLARPAC